MGLKKKLILLFLVVSLLKLVKISFSVEITPMVDQTMKDQPIDLDIEAIYQPCENPNHELCVPYPTNLPHPESSKQDHEFGLISEGLPSNTDYYIVGCINTENGAKCTTGNSQLDNFLNSFNGGDVLTKDPTYEFKALENPKKSDNQGTLQIVVRSYTPYSTSHFFKAYRLINQTIVNVSTIEKGVKQGIINFTTSAPTQQPTRKRVREINHDPKGRFFDIRSLEPIPEGEITLFNQDKKQFNYKNLINPQPVKINGEFNFWVPNGIYYLNPNSLPTGYIWPVKIEDIDPNYLKAYYCDPEVKDKNNKSAPLYLEQYPIYEFNKLVHCDFPLNPGTNLPYSYDVKTVSFSNFRNADNSKITFSGKVTHPLTIVYLKEIKKNRIIAKTYADKFGYWLLTLDKKSYPLDEEGLPMKITVSYQKIDLTGKKTYQEKKSDIEFEPILSYIEGYAYDENNQIIPNARVGYEQQGTSKVVYLTIANNQGYFKIPTVYLPTFSYKLVFLGQKKEKPTLISTSNFIKNNSSYLQKTKIDLLKTKNDQLPPEKLIKFIDSSLNKDNQLNNQNNFPQSQNINQKDNNQRLRQLTITIVILFTLIIITVSFIYIKKKKDSSF